MAGQAADLPVFVDMAAASGLDFIHFNGMSGELYYPEMTGSGGALFDYDNDGDLDVYFVQGTMMGPEKTLEDAVFPPKHPVPLTDRLYRNDLGEDGDPSLRFTDVTAEAGLVSSSYGMGVAAGDFNNDGWIDLYVTNFGSNELLQNNGDGTFADVTSASGTDDGRWSVSAAFFDYDGDGWLDLYVGNYVNFSYTLHKICPRTTGARDYCGPLAYDSQGDSLFRNRGDGTFEDVSARAKINVAAGGALGVVSGDFNADGRLDIYVANDLTPNHLWVNQGDGTFLDDALMTGSAVNRSGQSEASMGVAVADFDGDGDEDLFMVHLLGETNTLFVNDGSGLFTDRTLETGLGTPSWNFTSFGTGWIDFDNDGLLDLFIANGDVKGMEEQVNQSDPYPLRQTNQLFQNRGDDRFEEVTHRAGAVFELWEVSRGAAFGDVDNDGDTDILVVNNSGPARLLINQVGQDNHWVGLRLVTAETARDAIGAHATLMSSSGQRRSARVRTGSSFASANDPRLLFGLGGEPAVEWVEVDWPSGLSERFDDIEADRYNLLVEGEGEPLQP